MIEITDLAAVKLKEVIETDDTKYLRILIEGMGWGGPQLGLALDEPQQDDETLRIEGIDILVDKRALPYAADSTVDYIDSLWGKGFTIQPAYGGAC